jgi:FKBP-type peptidyl-prolyl cis-trans isomerase FklB
MIKSFVSIMKLKLLKALILILLMVLPAVAQESKPDAKLPAPPDKEKLSYALGMNLGQQLKQSGVDVDVDLIAQAIRDVMEGKPTQIQESEIHPLFAQAQGYTLAKKARKNRADGEAYLATNAKAEGVTVLPDGLQYKVIQDGAGNLPKPTDLVTFNFRGSWIDGTDFRNKGHEEIPLKACPKGLQEAFLLMKAGSKWQIFLPADLVYHPRGAQAPGFGSTLVYEVELLSAEPESAHPSEHHGAGRLGHSLDEDILPPAPASR